jgi:hypothetical protein
MLDKTTLKSKFAESLLAKHLKDIFDSFYYRRSTTLKLNRWVQFSLNQSPNLNELKPNYNVP